MNIKRKYYFLAFSILPLLFILKNPGITPHTQMMSQSLLRPFLSAGSSFSSSFTDFFNYFNLFWKTFEEQQQNRARISELESKLELYQEAVQENQRLKKMLDFKSQHRGKSVAARVIGWDLTPWRKRVILDKGSKQGIRKDMPVVVPEGLVGRILDVGTSTSRAILLTDPDSRVSALAADSRGNGLIAGNGSNALEFRFLDTEAGIAVGESVLTSGVTQLFPKGIRIGKIKGLSRDKDGLHLTGEVVSVASFSKLEEVLCIASYQPQ
ncbi:MAG: rod shape-determining protein MreC [Candidatus Omnitrophica bacterium]|nr:rod shape-determining protein MreC [Candidatus Omnitrophota bacterium]